MRELWQSLMLGAIQGATEFLPISSSGHLAVLEAFAGVKADVLLLGVILHLGTLAAVCIYYRKTLLELLAAGVTLLADAARGKVGGTHPGTPARRMLVNVFVADVLAVTVAVMLHDSVEVLSTNVSAIGVFFVLTGVLLVLTSFVRAAPGTLGWKHALVIGAVQGIAVLPGISRSGVTIFAALLFTANREEAVKFSFIISVPVTLGAAIFELMEEGAGAAILGSSLLYLPGAVVSFAVGWVSLGIVERLAIGRSLSWFALYLIPLGLVLAFLGDRM